jgi:hypothetical protein
MVYMEGNLGTNKRYSNLKWRFSMGLEKTAERGAP